MPTYEYECKSCAYRFEAFQQISDKPLEKCPVCKQDVRRLISAGGGIIFKGSGFYATDYRKKEAPRTPPACPGSADSAACKGCPKKDA